MQPQVISHDIMQWSNITKKGNDDSSTIHFKVKQERYTTRHVASTRSAGLSRGGGGWVWLNLG